MRYFNQKVGFMKNIFLMILLVTLSACGNSPLHTTCGTLMEEAYNTQSPDSIKFLDSNATMFTYSDRVVIFYIQDKTCVKEAYNR